MMAIGHYEVNPEEYQKLIEERDNLKRALEIFMRDYLSAPGDAKMEDDPLNSAYNFAVEVLLKRKVSNTEAKEYAKNHLAAHFRLSKD